MANYLQRFLPEYNEDEARERLMAFGADDLREMVLRAYKEKRLLLKMLAEADSKLRRVQGIVAEPSALSAMPDVPDDDELKKLFEGS